MFIKHTNNNQMFLDHFPPPLTPLPFTQLLLFQSFVTLSMKTCFYLPLITVCLHHMAILCGSNPPPSALLPPLMPLLQSISLFILFSLSFNIVGNNALSVRFIKLFCLQSGFYINKLMVISTGLKLSAIFLLDVNRRRSWKTIR